MKDELKEYMESVDSSNAPKFNDRSDFYYPKVKEPSGLESLESTRGLICAKCSIPEISINTRDYEIIKKELKEYAQYKAIEKELGIDLVTYFRAKNEGAWYKDIDNNICWCDMPSFSKGDIDFNGYHTTTRMYGVIWALTKEELEK